MLEAKGLMGGYLPRLSDEELREDDFYTDIMKQGRRQNDAAVNRGVDWYFADKRFADLFEKEFEREGYSNIKVHYQEAILKKFEDCIALIKRHLRVWRRTNSRMLVLSRLPVRGGH